MNEFENSNIKTHTVEHNILFIRFRITYIQSSCSRKLKKKKKKELHAHLFIKRYSFRNNYAYILRKERKYIYISPPQDGKKTQDLKGVKRQEVNSSYLVSSASGNGSWFQPK